MKREQIIEELTRFYESKGIVPNENFNCPKNKDCTNRNIPLAQGMQCHVGSCFGEDKIKVLVVSLDCGAGGKANIIQRTKDVEVKDDTNPHMMGTKLIISDILQYENKSEALKHFAMTNSCKCTRKDSNDTNQLPDYYFKQCADYKENEIEIINPDIIYFQGVRALIGLTFKNIDNNNPDISNFLKKLIIGKNEYLAVQCIHPSARGRSYKTKKKFYSEQLPLINNYIRNLLDV